MLKHPKFRRSTHAGTSCLTSCMFVLFYLNAANQKNNNAFLLNVEYENLPLFCSCCHSIGHSLSSYNINVKVDQTKMVPQVNHKHMASKYVSIKKGGLDKGKVTQMDNVEVILTNNHVDNFVVCGINNVLVQNRIIIILFNPVYCMSLMCSVRWGHCSSLSNPFSSGW